jgi:hypothetical protein
MTTTSVAGPPAACYHRRPARWLAEPRSADTVAFWTHLGIAASRAMTARAPRSPG